LRLLLRLLQLMLWVVWLLGLLVMLMLWWGWVLKLELLLSNWGSLLQLLLLQELLLV
jgi:hypothetical protein